MGLNTKFVFVPIHQEELFVVPNKALCEVACDNGPEPEEIILSGKSGRHLGRMQYLKWALGRIYS